MIKHLMLATALLALPTVAQTTAGGVVGGTAPTPYSPAGAAPRPGTTPSGLGSTTAPGSAVTPALPQPSTGVTPPIGAASAGTIGDGRVGTLAPGGSTSPAVNGQPGMSPTSGVSTTTPTTNPAPQ